MDCTNKRRKIYLDNAATTKMSKTAINAMLPYMDGIYGNPSSLHSVGQEANEALTNARERIAKLLGCEPREITFTSGGSEADNQAIISAAKIGEKKGKKHIVSTAFEHHAALHTLNKLEKEGFEVTLLDVHENGLITAEQVRDAIREDTCLVTVMYANNETGVIFPIAEVSKICKKHGVLFHSDAVQAAGKLKIDVKELGVDFLSLSAHKIHAPKGIGALYVRNRTPFQPYIIGGHQERQRRAGTENVPYIVGFGKAAELCLASLEEENTRVRSLRDRLEEGILSQIPYTRLNGNKLLRIPNTSNISFEYIESEAILMMFDQLGICASSGSACTTGSVGASHVLSAMGLSPMQARGSVRFSLSRYTTDKDIDVVLEHLPSIINKLRAMSPLNEAHPDNV